MFFHIKTDGHHYLLEYTQLGHYRPFLFFVYNVFYFVPYVEEVLSGAAINRLSNTDKKISEIQTTLIFQKSKYFPNNTQISFAFIAHAVSNDSDQRKLDGFKSNPNPRVPRRSFNKH